MAHTAGLTTERCVLEPLTIEHADEMVHILAARELYEFYPDEPSPSLAELRDRYTRQVRGSSADGTQVWHNWIITLAASGESIGFIQATVTGDLAELAWVVGVPWQGNGYASEAARAIQDSCLTGLTGPNIHRICCHIHPDNTRSQRVAIALGLGPTQVWQDGELRWESTPPLSS